MTESALVLRVTGTIDHAAYASDASRAATLESAVPLDVYSVVTLGRIPLLSLTQQDYTKGK
jgi:hypothetical protein